MTFVLPLAFVNWVPGLYILGRPYPLDLPAWLAFAPRWSAWPAVRWRGRVAGGAAFVSEYGELGSQA